MLSKALFVWVEDLDELRLFEVVLKPLFEELYEYVVIRTYSRMRRQEVTKFLKAASLMPADYIFVCDLDGAPCMTSRKDSLTAHYAVLNRDNIVIAAQGIESWYLAGLVSDICRAMGIRAPRHTDSLTKEQFDQLMPPQFDSRIDWMQEVLENYSVDLAKKKNSSFRYFVEKYGL